MGLEVGRAHHVLEAEANSLINLGIDFDHTGKGEDTLAKFHEAESIFERDAWFRWRYNIRLQAGACEHWLAQNDLEQAGDYADRLLEVANQYEAHKYIALGHKLRAELRIARGNLSDAETELNAALEQLRNYPAPLVAWKTYALLGRLRLQSGNASGSPEAYAQAATIVNSIAARTNDEELRQTFLNSPAIVQVFRGAEKITRNKSAKS